MFYEHYPAKVGMLSLYRYAKAYVRKIGNLAQQTSTSEVLHCSYFIDKVIILKRWKYVGRVNSSFPKVRSRNIASLVNRQACTLTSLFR